MGIGSWFGFGNAGQPTNGYIGLGGSTVGSELMSLLMCDEIQPGSAPSYSICKSIYSFHPLGGKMADAPVRMAMSKPREIQVLGDAETPIAKAFQAQWEKMRCDEIIANVKGQSRVYGAAAVGVLAEGLQPNDPLKPEEIAKLKLHFKVWDPLNTAGSLVVNQNPNALDYQEVGAITAAGTQYHRSRTCVILNEQPLYIEYTDSAFGYVGRSVYQRALFPLKSFVQTMITNDLVSKKAGLLIAKIKAPGSVIDNVMAQGAQQKRQMIQQGMTGNVISCAPDESIETLNMMNLDGAGKFARDNILQDISSAADLHPWFLTNDSFSEGFGEGTEDANAVAANVNRIRREMEPLYRFFDPIVMRRAWTEEFYAALQAEQPDRWEGVSYTAFFQECQNSFDVSWPNLIQESDEEKSKSAKVVVDAVKAVLETLLPILDPENRALLVGWCGDTLNQLQQLFPIKLSLDLDALREYEPPASPGPDDGDGGENVTKSDSQWSESDHPRAEDGKFGSGGGGKSKTPKAKLTPTEKAWVTMYSGDHFLDLNAKLRGGGDGGGMAKALDAAISKSTLPTGTKLYRGMKTEDAVKLLGGREVTKGQIVEDKSFMSTGKDKDFVSNFYGSGGVMFEISTSEGQKGLPMDGLSDNKSENEVLLPRGTKLRILSIHPRSSPRAPVVFKVETVSEDSETAQDSYKLEEGSRAKRE